MNMRERLLAVLKHERPDVTPWAADLSWWWWAQQTKGTLDSRYLGEEGYLRLHRETGTGIYLYPPGLWLESEDPTIRRQDRREGNRTISTITTPAGAVSCVLEHLPETFSTAYREHFIKKAEDLAVMRYVFTHRTVTPSFTEFTRIDALWNGWGLPAALAPCCVSPLQLLLSRWAGVPTTIELLADAQTELEETLAVLQSSDDVIFRIICDSPAQMVCFPENLSGEITGRRLMEQYELPYWNSRIEQLHRAGKFVLLHNDGTLQASLPLLAESGLDAVESVTPAPVGDMTLAEIKQVTAGKVIVWGGLPGALFSPIYPETVFVNHIRAALRTFPPGSGFVLASADQVPPEAPLDRIRMVQEIIATEAA